jgi:5'-nucleotidase
MTRFLPGAAAFVAALLVALLGLYANADTPSLERTASRPGTVRLRLLGVNDFHGHLEGPRPGIGGAAWLKAHLDRATVPGHTIRVHAGDMIGATPLISSWFHDEPTMEAGNEMGFDVGTLGNHEFDEGGDELIRMLRGGQRTGPQAYRRDADGRLVNTSSPDYPGAAYPYIAANTIDREGRLHLPPYLVIRRAGVRVGFIGVTTPVHTQVPARPLRPALPLHRHLGRGQQVGRGAPCAGGAHHRRAGARGRTDAGRVERARLHRRDRRRGAPDEPRRGRRDRGP